MLLPRYVHTAIWNTKLVPIFGYMMIKYQGNNAFAHRCGTTVLLKGKEEENYIMQNGTRQEGNYSCIVRDVNTYSTVGAAGRYHPKY